MPQWTIFRIAAAYIKMAGDPNGVSGIVLGKIMAHLLLAARYLTLHTADANFLLLLL